MAISAKIKRDLYNIISKQINPYNETHNTSILDFLGEIWDLANMPSQDSRFNNAEGDVYQHVINNNDWDNDYLFTQRLKLLDSDEKFKAYIETIVSPKFRITEEEILIYVEQINALLESQDFILAVQEYNEEGLPIYLLQDRDSRSDFPPDIVPINIPFFVTSRKNPNAHLNAYPAFRLVFNNGWNDYSRCTEFTLNYFESASSFFSIGVVKIAHKIDMDTSGIIPSKFISLGEDFFSLGQSEDYYYNLKKSLKQNFYGVLYALKDCAFFHEIHDKYERNSNFTNSLIRYDYAERVLREIKYKISGRALDSLYKFRFVFRPQYSDSLVNVDFSFNNNAELPNRICGIIGKNGAGKTQLLTSLPTLIAKGETNFFQPNIPMFSKIIAVSYSSFDRFSIPNKTSSFNYVYCGLRSINDELISEKALALRFHRSWKKIVEQERSTKWRKVLLNFIERQIVDEFIIVEPNSSRENRYTVDIRGFNGVRNKLSSGQSIMLFIITEIVAQIRLDSLLLYDEPETHLHPNAITQLMNTIYELVEEFESYCIIATHSPLVIRELFSKNVYVMERHENTPSVRKISMECFGENLSVLTEEVFGNKEVPKQYKSIIENLTKKGRSFEEIIEILEDPEAPLSLNTRIFIKATINAQSKNI